VGNHSTRRDFLKQVTYAGAALPFIMSSRARAQGDDKHPDVRIAFIGTGGIGGAHLDAMKELGVSCPCYCDVDRNMWGKASEQYPDAKQYQDYRKMLDAESTNIDGVMIGVPDHQHFPATIMAMHLGVNVYTQKPLTHTVWESRQLYRAARKYRKLVTQMGNQGHASDNFRLLHEIIRAGGIGDVKEVYTWTDRPIWPQGMDRPAGEDPVPENLDWDIWIGPAKMRPFKQGAYHSFVWRGWKDFGTGALGDMGCHMMDATFWGLEPEFPTSVEATKVEGMTSEAYPNKSIIKWEYPANDWRPGFSQYWLDGKIMPDRPEGMAADQNLDSNGSIFIGTKGTLIMDGAGGRITTAPAKLMEEIGNPPQLQPRSIGHYKEWVLAIKGEGRTWANFEYSSRLAEGTLLGCVALNTGHRVEWDGEKCEATNCEVANSLVTKEYREGWDFGAER